jgi:hypothetical protein
VPPPFGAIADPGRSSAGPRRSGPSAAPFWLERCGDALTCRNEYVIRVHIYASTSILTHCSLDLFYDRRVPFPPFW